MAGRPVSEVDMVEVAPIAWTEVDWRTLLALAGRLLGRSVTQGCDARGLPVGDLASFVIALGELEREGSDPVEVLRRAGPLLRHLHFAFLVASDRSALQEVAMATGLKALLAEGGACAVISGNLEEWRTAIINGCTARSSRVVRTFTSRCLAHFERAGLGQLWVEFARRPLTDATLLLELKT